MSAYTTLAKFKTRLGANPTDPIGIYDQITDRVTARVANDAVGQELVDAGAAEINGRLSRRYLTPIDVSIDPALAGTLEEFNLVIAEFKGYALHPAKPRIPERVSAAYRSTIDQLDAIAAGDSALPGAAAIPSATSSGPRVIATGNDRQFTQENLKGL